MPQKYCGIFSDHPGAWRIQPDCRTGLSGPSSTKYRQYFRIAIHPVQYLAKSIYMSHEGVNARLDCLPIYQVLAVQDLDNTFADFTY